jgi:hypothetical protein
MRRQPTNSDVPAGPPVAMSRDPRSVEPVVHPNVQDPAARAYAASIANRRGKAPPAKYAVPVAGGPSPSMPHLDSEHVPGVPIAEQSPEAIAARLGHTQGLPARFGAGAGGIVEGGVPAPSPASRAPGAPPPGILPVDTLPPEAVKDPAFQQGTGSMIAANQPMLAYKYGVVRNGQLVPPQQLRASAAPAATGGAGRKLSPNTLEGLQALDEFNKARQANSPEGVLDRQVQEEAAAGPAGQSQDTAGATEKPLSDEEKEALLEGLDEFDFSRFRQATMRDMLNNKEQKSLIESRLKPLNLGELIMRGRVSQVVPIQPGSFEPEFQSYNGEEDLVIKRLITAEAKSLNVIDRYFIDKYSLMGLTVSLKAVSGVQLPSAENDKGEFDEERFWAKYNIVAKFNYHMISSLVVNWYWFDLRVRKLFVAEDVGNG